MAGVVPPSTCSSTPPAAPVGKVQPEQTAVRSGKVTEIVEAPTVISARAVTKKGLAAFASGATSPVYWAGPSAGTTYELSRTKQGNTYVRYLGRGTKVGSAQPSETIGTYPVEHAFALTSALARKAGSIRVPVSHGGIAFYNASHPTSVYLAYPGEDVQVEVYDPSPARAHTLVATGAIKQVG